MNEDSKEFVLPKDQNTRLAKIYGLNNIKEFNEKLEVELPEPIHRYMINAQAKTLADYHEYWAHFGLEESGIRIVDEGQGTEMYLVGNQIIFASEQNKPDVNLLTAPNLLVHFHSHPIVDINYLKSKALLLVKVAGVELNVKQIVTFLNAVNANISFVDLQRVEEHRYIKSSLLSTGEGIRLIVNPDFKRHFIISNKGTRLYRGRLQPLIDNRVRTMFRDHSDNMDLPGLQNERDVLLADFCRSNGMILFGNNNYRDPVLKRLSKI